jgi:hypothetical protein
VDAPVLQQLLERHAGDLAADAVEAGEDHRVGRVVDDEVDPGEVLERADVAALAADDPAPSCRRGSWTTETVVSAAWPAARRCMHGEDVAHAAVGVALGLLLDLADEAAESWRIWSSSSLRRMLGLRGGIPNALELADVTLAKLRDLLFSLRQVSLGRLELSHARLERSSRPTSRSSRRPISALRASASSSLRAGGFGGLGAVGRSRATGDARHALGQQQRGDHQTSREAQGHHDRRDHDFHFPIPLPRHSGEPPA